MKTKLQMVYWKGDKFRIGELREHPCGRRMLENRFDTQSITNPGCCPGNPTSFNKVVQGIEHEYGINLIPHVFRSLDYIS